MDSDLIQQVARLKVRLRQGQNLSLNTQRFFGEPDYAQQMLDLAEQSDDEEVVIMGIALRLRMGLIALPVVAQPVVEPVVHAPEIPLAIPPRPEEVRYLRGARS